jgi:hypothetical protein
MQSQRAILVVESRLMRELVRRVIEKKVGFEVIRELADVQELPSAIIDTGAEWVFVILLPNREIPESLKIELLKHPTLRMIGLWIDGSHVRMDWLVHEQKNLTGETLEELTRLLRQELHTFQNMKDNKDRG